MAGLSTTAHAGSADHVCIRHAARGSRPSDRQRIDSWRRSGHPRGRLHPQHTGGPAVTVCTRP